MFLSKKLWIIEDMIDLQPVYENIFKDEKFHLKFFTSFCEFKDRYIQKKKLPDLIIADIHLEDGHFFDLLKDSEITLNTPSLVISSSSDMDNLRGAFQADAIDYLIKPFNKNEVLAKVERHLINIEEKIQKDSLSLESLKLDINSYTNKEIKIIESFNTREDKRLHRNEVTKVIWKNVAIHPNTLDVHIYNLRKKLKKDGYGVKSVGNGYFKFIKLEVATSS
jgi:DNA-binding response OmpR family regulator